MIEEYNYQYDIDVLVKCEHCDNQFIRHDILKTTYSEIREDLENMYSNLQEDEPDDEKIYCEKCDGFMFEEKLLEIKETKLKEPTFEEIF